MKKVYYSQDIPSGFAIVVANDEEEARKLLDDKLKECGQPVFNYTLERVSRAEPVAMVFGGDDAP
jgi:CheY-like chemotaxis protein